MMSDKEERIMFLEDISDAIMKKYKNHQLISYDGKRAGFMIHTEKDNIGYLYISVRITGVTFIDVVEYEFNDQEEDAIRNMKELKDFYFIRADDKHCFIIISEGMCDENLYMEKIEQAIRFIALIISNYGTRIGIPNQN